MPFWPLSISLNLAQHLLHKTNHETVFGSDNLGAYRLVVSPDTIEYLRSTACTVGPWINPEPAL